ncbi:hypothetical protein [Serratia proteamaculans]|uniref:hypothetical protein n=1 Tax=Serratia proteamaculans TaxID=28151 RepID=UPI003CFC0640
MGSQASIDMDLFQSCQPQDVVVELVRSGWSVDFEEEVMFLLPSDAGSYEWRKEHVRKFELESFLSSHSTFGSVGIVMVFDEKFGGEFLICKDWISLSLSINRVCLFDDVPDFTEYIVRLRAVIDKFGVSGIRCEYF